MLQKKRSDSFISVKYDSAFGAFVGCDLLSAPGNRPVQGAITELTPEDLKGLLCSKQQNDSKAFVQCLDSLRNSKWNFCSGLLTEQNRTAGILVKLITHMQTIPHDNWCNSAV